MPALLRRLLYLLRHREQDDALGEELEFHRALKQQELDARGLSAEDARLAARRELGNVTRAREDSRAVWLWPWLESVWQDARFAVRGLLRQPGVTLLSVIVLGVAIGLNVIGVLFLRPPRTTMTTAQFSIVLPWRCTSFAAEDCMQTTDIASTLGQLFSELVDGAPGGNAFILNSGDLGLLRSLERLSADDASRSVNDGATIAAHAQHVRYGLSLMNRWALEGGNPFADAKWDEAWRISTVDNAQWAEIRGGLTEEAHRWLGALATPRQVADIELAGMLGSIAHLAYHLGAIRQINKGARGPKEGSF